MSQVADKIIQKIASKLSPKGGIETSRPDVYLADVHSISPDSCRILLGWAYELGKPSLKAVENFVIQRIDQVKMHHASLRWFEKQAVASVIVSKLLPSRRLEDTKTMTRLAPNRYLEAETKHVWEVRESVDKEKYLVRHSADNLEELLLERKKKLAPQRAASFASLKDAGLPDVQVGDHVRFYHEGLMREGKVKVDLGDEFVVAAPVDTADTKFKAPKESVVDVVTKDPATVKDYKERAREYWEQIFPKEYLDKWFADRE